MAKIRLKKQYILMVYEAVQEREQKINRKLKRLKKEAQEADTTAEKLDQIAELEEMQKRYLAINEVLWEASKKKDSVFDDDLGPDKIVIPEDNSVDDSGFDIYTHLID